MYDIEDSDTESEALNKMRNIDLAQLYTEAISFLDVDLQSSLNIQAEIDRNVALIKDKEDKRKSKCKNYTLAKKYTDIEDLLEDNEKTIYFDRKYDETRYEIMEEYSAQRETMTTEELTRFVQEKLMENVGLEETQALYEANNMILGKKVVLDGHYGVLEVADPKSELPNGKNTITTNDKEINGQEILRYLALLLKTMNCSSVMFKTNAFRLIKNVIR